jgi:hypothetical protein
MRPHPIYYVANAVMMCSASASVYFAMRCDFLGSLIAVVLGSIAFVVTIEARE